ncbi:hypothetical protein [Rhodohalobacter sp. 8-1]|uniref:hypothetical protein n=1 Tax=Rhodohalobacter sp. 8-1 TaxID=3131972 RepID=UPI0030EF76DC
MKKLITATLLLLSGLGNLSAQNPSEVFIQQANVEHNEAVLQFTGDFTTAFSNQTGLESFDQYDSDTNVAIVNQFGDNNISTLIQNGIGNMARFNIFGNSNTTGLEQDGSGNQFILNLEGSNNLIEGAQVGTENQVRIDLTGSGFPNQTFSQTGSNLSLQFFDNGTGVGVPLQIEQTGNGGSVIIENY